MCRPSHRNAIKQATKHVDFPQPHYTDKFVEVPVAMQRQVPQVQTLPKTMDVPSINQVTKHAESPQTHNVDKVVDTLVRQVTKHVEIPPAQHIDKVVEVHVVTTRQVPQT